MLVKNPKMNHASKSEALRVSTILSLQASRFSTLLSIECPESQLLDKQNYSQLHTMTAPIIELIMKLIKYSILYLDVFRDHS